MLTQFSTHNFNLFFNFNHHNTILESHQQNIYVTFKTLSTADFVETINFDNKAAANNSDL